MNHMQTFEGLLEKLAKSEVEFILVGGLAVDLCGFVRTTEDVDIIVRHSTDNIRRLLRCLASFGEGSARELSAADFVLEEGSIRIVEDFPVDVFTVMSGRKYEDLLSLSSVHTTEKSVRIRHLNAEGLILLKKDSLRPKDRLDVEELTRLKNHPGRDSSDR
jgi:hypothetical protein